MHENVYNVLDMDKLPLLVLEDAIIVNMNFDTLFELLKSRNEENNDVYKEFCINYKEFNYEVGYFTLLHKTILPYVIAKDENVEKCVYSKYIFPTHEPRYYTIDDAWCNYVNKKREDEDEYISLDNWGYNNILGLFSKIDFPNEESIF